MTFHATTAPSTGSRTRPVLGAAVVLPDRSLEAFPPLGVGFGPPRFSSGRPRTACDGQSCAVPRLPETQTTADGWSVGDTSGVAQRAVLLPPCCECIRSLPDELAGASVPAASFGTGETACPDAITRQPSRLRRTALSPAWGLPPSTRPGGFGCRAAFSSSADGRQYHTLAPREPVVSRAGDAG